MCRQKTIYSYLTSGRVTTKNILNSRKMLGQNDEHQEKLIVTIMVTLIVAVIMA